MSSFRGNFNSAQGQSSFLVAFPQLLDLTLDHFYDFAQQFYFFNRILTAVINKNNVRTENNRRSRIIVYNLFSKIFALRLFRSKATCFHFYSIIALL